MAVTLGYSSTLSNVTITASALGTNTNAALVERSADGGTSYTQVRGARLWPVSAGSFTTTLNDYEFSPNEVNTYRVSSYDDGTVYDIPTALNGLVLDGASGSYASTPDAATLDITGDIDLRAEVSAQDWTPSATQSLVGKWNSTGNQRGYELALEPAGTLTLYWSTAGTVTLSATSTTAVSVPDTGRLACRVTMDVNDGGGNRVITFYTASAIDGTWTQLGSVITTAGTTSIFANTVTLEAGTIAGGTAERFAGVIHAIEVRNGIAGTVVANPDFTAQTNADTSFNDTAAVPKTWTVNGAAEIVVPQTNTTTPTITDVWLKSPVHPFLNRTVRVVGYEGVTRPSRSGVFDIVGRTYPIAVTDVRASRRFNLTIRTDTRQDAEDTDLILAAGDVMFLQIPPDTSYLWLPPAVYINIGDVSQTRHGTKDGVLCDFALPCTEVAPPDLDVYGSLATWATITTQISDWDDVVSAFGDWGDVMDLIGDPEDVIVP